MLEEGDSEINPNAEDSVPPSSVESIDGSCGVPAINPNAELSESPSSSPVLPGTGILLFKDK